MENKIFTHPHIGEMYYLIDIPDSVKGQENIPLLIFLHGAGERGRSYEKIKVHGVPKYIENGTFKPNLITVCPQCPEGIIWNNLVLLLKDFIEFIIKEHNIDRRRISLTGLSMGGYGTWEMAMTYPDMFKKIAPICGGGTSWRANLIKSQVWTFHGDIDDIVPIENSYTMVDALKKAGKHADFTIFHNVSHNSWEPAYEKTKVLEWLCDI